jgi:hypothetical protein
MERNTRRNIIDHLLHNKQRIIPRLSRHGILAAVTHPRHTSHDDPLAEDPTYAVIIDDARETDIVICVLRPHPAFRRRHVVWDVVDHGDGAVVPFGGEGLMPDLEVCVDELGEFKDVLGVGVLGGVVRVLG